MYACIYVCTHTHMMCTYICMCTYMSRMHTYIHIEASRHISDTLNTIHTRIQEYGLTSRGHYHAHLRRKLKAGTTFISTTYSKCHLMATFPP